MLIAERKRPKLDLQPTEGRKISPDHRGSPRRLCRTQIYRENCLKVDQVATH